MGVNHPDVKLSFLYLCGMEQSSSFYFFKLKSPGYCTSSTLLDSGIPFQKMQLKLLISSTDVPWVLLIWQLTLLLPAGFLVLQENSCQGSCRYSWLSSAAQLHWTRASSPVSCGNGCRLDRGRRVDISTHVKWAHHRRVINKHSKVQLVLIGYRLMSRCGSPVQDGLLIIFRRGFSGLKQWRNTGLAHLLNLWKSWFLPGVQAWCLLKFEEICDPCCCFSHCVLLLLKLPWLSSRESRAYLGHVTSHGQRQLDGCRLSWPL